MYKSCHYQLVIRGGEKFQMLKAVMIMSWVLVKLESCGKVFNLNRIIGNISSIDRKHLKLFLKDNN